MKTAITARRFCSLTAFLTAAHVAAAAFAADGQPQYLAVIRLNPDKQIEVVRLNSREELGTQSESGLLIWTDRQDERWQPLVEARASGAQAATDRQPLRLSAFTRAGEQNSVTDTQVASLSKYLDPLTDPEVTRGASFLTPPAQGILSNPRMTIRRKPRDTEPQFPADQLTLKSAGLSATFPVNKDQSVLKFEDYQTSLPSAWHDGLPAGSYELKSEKGEEASSFSVATEDQREELDKRLGQLENLLGNRTDPLYVQLAVESYLEQKDDDAKDLPFVADALDAIERISTQKLTPFLLQKHREVLWRLSGAERPAVASTSDQIGIPEIDEARDLITAGKWSEADTLLERAISSQDKRCHGLACLYRAVVLTEASVGEEFSSNDDGALDAERWFQKAIESLKDESPKDLSRAYNNYGNFLLRRTQDRVSNHAVQISTGVSYPILRALFAWSDARTNYEEALKLSTTNDESAAISVNLARLYFQMAEMIRTIDVGADGGRNFAEGEQVASDHARDFALKAVTLASGHAPLVAGVAEEMLAHLAYRQRNWAECTKHCGQAREEYVAAGALAGLESIHRLSGMLALRKSTSRDHVQNAQSLKQSALTEFQLSHLISETLRERFPADRIGLSRAGFFARRTYVDSMIVELLIAEDKADEALCHLEHAKARSLQDLLATKKISNTEHDELSTTDDLAALLKQWPNETAALEYFLGPERSWGFLVNSHGQVRAFPLLNPDGQPAFTPDLIANVSNYLKTVGNQAAKMRRRLLDGKGYDNDWERSLFELRLQLIPDDILNELREVQTVVVVPQHILHYLPFSALVVQPDRPDRDQTQIARPVFLIDLPFTIDDTPSLTVWNHLRNQAQPIDQARAVAISEFGNAQTLPGVKDDVENFKTSFPNQLKDLYFGSESDEYHVKNLLAEPGILLFATHGMNLADQPLASFLLLHPFQDRSTGANEDGKLTASEIFSMDVKSDLIVMSACYSGLADRSPLPGDDLFGLQRAFLQSGAKAVVSGLWDVYDMTGPELMKGFFERLAAGQPTARALADSQREFLKKYRAEAEPDPFLHPYFWAVFTNCGSDRVSIATGN